MFDIINITWNAWTTPPFTQLLIFGFCLLLFGVIGRLITGFKPGRTPGRTATTCFTVILLYIATMALLSTDGHLMIFTAALPFLGNVGDGVGVAMMLKTDFLGFLLEVTQVFIMTFTLALIEHPINCLYSLITRNPILKFALAIPLFYPWYLMKCIVVFLALGINFGVDWLLTHYVSESFAKWLPVVFFIVLFIFLILFALRLLFSTVKFFTASFFRNIEMFFTENSLGKVLKTSLCTTIIITLVVLLFDWFGMFTPLFNLALGATIFIPVVLLLIAIAYIVWIFCF